MERCGWTGDEVDRNSLSPNLHFSVCGLYNVFCINSSTFLKIVQFICKVISTILILTHFQLILLITTIYNI